MKRGVCWEQNDQIKMAEDISGTVCPYIRKNPARETDMALIIR